MKFGKYEISLHNHGFFRLDGGAMFGAVPKNLWARSIAPDDENCIPLATRSLLIADEKRKILVDVGNGDKWNDKLKNIFAIDNTPESELGFKREEITHIILTHLHFDHAGGISKYSDSGSLELTYPNAEVILQKDNFENACEPNIREKASYLENHVQILNNAKLKLVEGSTEIFEGVWVHQVNGHTRGQQYVEVRSEEDTLLYPTDLIPTSHHLPVPYNMGYDICTQTILKEKQAFLEYALEKDALIVFQHDPEVAAVRIELNKKGHFGVRRVESL